MDDDGGDDGEVDVDIDVVMFVLVLVAVLRDATACFAFLRFMHVFFAVDHLHSPAGVLLHWFLRCTVLPRLFVRALARLQSKACGLIVQLDTSCE